MRINDDDATLLRTLCTNCEGGRHFTEVFPDDWLDRMEEDGLILIDRPIHEPTGIPWSQEYWSVEIPENVADYLETWA